jgi:2-succinyl-6-hydroxy-2,4-cyclohexadiene-1-carboxylate synthase
VFLHGFAGSPRSFAPIIEKLSLGRAVFAPALVGHDRSQASHVPPEEPATANPLEHEVDSLAGQIREHVGLGVHVVGYSLGARLALGLCVRHPDLVGRATWIGVNAGLETDREICERHATDAKWCELLETGGIETFVAAWETQPLFETQKRLAASVLERQRRERLSHSASGLAHALRRVGLAEMPNYWPALARLTPPVQLIVGELDAKFKTLAERAACELPRASLHVIPNAGHNVVLEAPLAVLECLSEAP